MKLHPDDVEELRAQIAADIAAVKSELASEIAAIRRELDALQAGIDAVHALDRLDAGEPTSRLH
jgi:hypothetical protein